MLCAWVISNNSFTNPWEGAVNASAEDYVWLSCYRKNSLKFITSWKSEDWSTHLHWGHVKWGVIKKTQLLIIFNRPLGIQPKWKIKLLLSFNWTHRSFRTPSLRVNSVCHHLRPNFLVLLQRYIVNTLQ